MIIKLKPLCFQKVWGGNALNKVYGYDCKENTGEAWGISGHKNGASIVMNTEFKGKSLRELYQEKPSLFGDYPTKEFPILIKVIDAQDDLSIQVHPDDAYAKKYENSLGKTECWYILDALKGTDIIIGHKAKTKAEFKQFSANNNFESVLNKFPVKKGDLFNIYSGTIHAICKGTLLLEIQQSSDITYRLYDYNRLSNGSLRELHINKALDVIKFPDNVLAKHKPTNLFDFDIYTNTEEEKRVADKYGDYIFILEGNGHFNDVAVKKGEFIFIPANTPYKVLGSLDYFVSVIKYKK